MKNNDNPLKIDDKKQMGIKWKMIAILVCFVSAVSMLIWIVQIRMLNFFYQNDKFIDLNSAAENISEVLDDKDVMAALANAYAEENDSDIWIYKTSNGNIDYKTPIFYAQGPQDNIDSILVSQFNVLHQKTISNEGVYIALVPVKYFKRGHSEFKILEDNFGNPDGYPLVSGNVSDMSIVYINTYSVGGEEYVVVQRSNITPVGTVIKALKNQVLFSGLLFVICALVLATIMSNAITKPIIKITKSAKRLADGKYDSDFTAHSYREIAELSDTLNNVSAELSKNDRLQKELIANVSHDLRTPLTMIKGYSEIMRDIPGENTPENVQVIIDETARLTDLVNDVFDLSKIQSGIRKPDMRVFSLTALVKETMNRYEKLTMQEGYKISFNFDSEVAVYADSGMLLQAVYNLINNAINYIGEDKTVIVQQTLIGDTVRISVTDNGEGIAEQDIPLIWDRYYKVDKVHKRSTVGTGVGLSIVKGVLELHNANYGVDSTAKQGSTFWFELKAVDKALYMQEY